MGSKRGKSWVDRNKSGKGWIIGNRLGKRRVDDSTDKRRKGWIVGRNRGKRRIDGNINAGKVGQPIASAGKVGWLQGLMFGFCKLFSR